MAPTSVRGALACCVLALSCQASAADRREKIAVMKVEAADLGRSEVASVRDRLEAGVGQAVGGRLQIITRDSAAANVGGGEKLLACLESASCDAEVGGALGVDYFVSASVRHTAAGLELGVTLLRIGREGGLLRKEVKAFPGVRALLDGTSAFAEAVVREALGAVPAPAGAPASSTGGSAAGMVELPGGSFRMEWRRDEVTLKPFLLDAVAVTVSAYEGCVTAGKCSTPKTDNFYCNWGLADRADHPVNCVDWSQAAAYCAFAGKRLPSEEEREWAARGGGKGSRYPWGDAAPQAQLCWNGWAVERWRRGLGTCAVGSFPAGDSPQGIKDLAGNVSEWTSSAHPGSARATRGGAWNADRPDQVAAGTVSTRAATESSTTLGFRCARGR